MSSEIYEYVCPGCDSANRINLPAPPYYCAWCGYRFAEGEEVRGGGE